MKSLTVVLLSFCLVISSFAQDIGWPREKTTADATIIYYQPQLDDWKNFRQLDARMAVSIRTKTGQPTVGVVYLRARTDADLDTHNVVLSHLEVVSTKLPSLDQASAAAMDQMIKTFLSPAATLNISLERLMAELEEKKQDSEPAVSVKNDPPKIFVAYDAKAILLLVDGELVRAPIEKTNLEFVVNTNWDLVFDKPSSKYFLLNGKTWLTAAALEGPWTTTAKLPADMSKIPDQPNWADVKKAIPPPAGAGATAPKVFYSSVPAEIITFKGKPVYAEIPNTQLSYATNTESNVFLHSGENQYYYLVSGRWFRAKTLDGPWTFATPDLPADFAKIPPKSVASRVLVSVPGTNEANDAVLLAQVPNTVIVDRAKAEAEVAVSYDGEPKFDPIEDTSLSYASNTQDKVIKVGDLYYLCFQGVWFMSTAPSGPWKTRGLCSSRDLHHPIELTGVQRDLCDTDHDHDRRNRSEQHGRLSRDVHHRSGSRRHGCLRKRLLLSAVLLSRTVSVSDLSPLPHHLRSWRLLQPAQRGVRCCSRSIWAIWRSRRGRLVQPIHGNWRASRWRLWCVWLCGRGARLQPVHGRLRCNAAGLECLQPMGKLSRYQG